MHGKEDIAEYEIHRNIALKKRNYSLNLGETCSSKFDAFLNKTMDKIGITYAKFERRESQQLMMKEIYTALRDSRFSLIEAGTGTGKTLAYLLPIFILQREKKNLSL